MAADVAAIRVDVATLLALVKAQNLKEIVMAGSFDSLTAQVAANTSVVGSAITLINGFAAQLAAAGTDPVKLQALQDSLNSSDTALAAAVAANTSTPPAGGGPPSS